MQHLILRKNKLKILFSCFNQSVHQKRSTMRVQNVVSVHVCTLSVFSPLADRRVNDVLLQTFPSISKALLQLIDVVQTTFVHSLLHESPYLIVDRVKVWAVGRLEVSID